MSTHPTLTRSDALAQAISAQDPAAAQACCAPAGWGPERDTPRGLYEQAVRKRLTLGAAVLLAEQEGRAAVAVPLLRGAPGEQNIVASLYLLDAGQGLVGLTRLAQLAHLFVEGVLSAPCVFEQLPAAPSAMAYVVEQVSDLDAALERLDYREPLGGLTQLRSRALAGEPLELGRSYALVERYAVEVHVGLETYWWMLQGTPSGALQTRLLSAIPGFERLLDNKPLTPRASQAAPRLAPA